MQRTVPGFYRRPLSVLRALAQRKIRNVRYNRCPDTRCYACLDTQQYIGSLPKMPNGCTTTGKIWQAGLERASASGEPSRRSIVVGGLGDGLGGVEWEAEVAFAVTPGILGFAGLLMAVVGGKGGAEFKGGI